MRADNGRASRGGAPWTAAAPVTLALTLILLVGAPLVGTAQEPDDPEPVDLGTYAEPIHFDAPDDMVMELVDAGSGRTHRLVGRVELIRTAGGFVLVNEVPMRTYLEGIQEVPLRWHMEALKAQVVAARTYAWRAIRRSTYEHYDICATVACQVFHGRDVVEAPDGDRWVAAVAATEDEVLLHDGEPILARYFSTSGGHTRNNEHVFPSEGAYPYLVGVEDPEDEVSPLHTWQVSFTREEMDEILSRGQRLSAVAPLEAIEVVPAAGGRTDQVRVTGAGGATVTMNASTFRAFVSDTAAELYPDRYPSPRDDGAQRLPLTLPSSRFSFEVTDEEVIVDGRGFGHGVGMSQYGAMGKAQDGMTYDEILAAYYNGITPQHDERVPDLIRVGLTDGAEGFTLRAEGPVRVLAGDRVVTERGMGRWRVSQGPDGGARLAAPGGFGAALIVAPTRVTLDTPSEVHVVRLDVAVNKPVELRLDVTGPDGETDSRDLGVVEPGAEQVTWSLDDAAGEPLPAGTYDVALRATDEEGDVAGDPVEVTVRPVEAPTRPPDSVLGPAPERGLDTLTVGGAGVVGAAIGLVASRRTSTTEQA